MKILVLGATGRTGNEIVRQGLLAGHDITAFVRTPANIIVQNQKLHVVQGDVNDGARLAAALQGQDALIVALGPTSSKGAKTFMSEAVTNIIEAMYQTGIKRVVILSSFIVLRDRLRFGTKLLTGMMKGMAADKVTGEDLLRKSGLAWTIVYATRLTNKSDDRYLTLDSERLGIGHAISRSAVAHAMLDLLDDKSAVRRHVVVTGSK